MDEIDSIDAERRAQDARAYFLHYFFMMDERGWEKARQLLATRTPAELARTNEYILCRHKMEKLLEIARWTEPGACGMDADGHSAARLMFNSVAVTTSMLTSQVLAQPATPQQAPGEQAPGSALAPAAEPGALDRIVDAVSRFFNANPRARETARAGAQAAAGLAARSVIQWLMSGGARAAAGAAATTPMGRIAVAVLSTAAAGEAIEITGEAIDDALQLDAGDNRTGVRVDTSPRGLPAPAQVDVTGRPDMNGAPSYGRRI